MVTVSAVSQYFDWISKLLMLLPPYLYKLDLGRFTCKTACFCRKCTKTCRFCDKVNM